MRQFFLVEFAFFEHVYAVAAADNRRGAGFRGVNHCLGNRKAAFGKVREFKYAHRAVPKDGFAIQKFASEQFNRFRSDI